MSRIGTIIDILSEKLRYNREYRYYNEILPYLNFEPIVNKKMKKVRTITFVVPRMVAFSGGHTSILRLGTSLSNLGYEINYVTYFPQDLNEMKLNAEKNLKNYKGECHSIEKLNILQSDVWIATMFDSVYRVKDLTGYKMYFVQDYEPYFFTFGEKYILAQKTYEMGFHMVSLGKWNKEMIEKTCSNIQQLDYIDFPYEKSEYKEVKRNFDAYAGRREYNLAAYIKNTEKRAPFILQNILEKVKAEFKKEGIILNINYFGEDKKYKYVGGNNLGKLNKNQLFELYRNSDFGLVASLSNISLVPYEMVATRLPVIEFKEGTFSYFFKESSAILTSFDWKELYGSLKKYIKEPNKLCEMTEQAYGELNELSWESSAKQFEKILKNNTI